MTLVQYIATAVNLFFLGMVLVAVYKGKLREAYALIWLIAAVVILLLSLSPRLLGLLSEILGIKTPAFALLSCLLMGMLFLLFQVTVVQSKLHERITRLTEELALLREKQERK